MAALTNLALESLLARIDPELVMAQVLVRRLSRGYELRHVEDRDVVDDALRPVPAEALRGLAQSTAEGAFRPLKSAPNLVRGWRTVVLHKEGLDWALQQLYPGSVADWHAAQRKDPPVTHYRDFTRRQTGMYRITYQVTDGQAEHVARAVCAPEFCLKRRLWTVGQLDPDGEGTKSMIPCLEPCAILLEFARQAVRWGQEDRVPVMVSRTDLECLLEAIQRQRRASPDPAMREADFGDSLNRRRLRWMAEQLLQWKRQMDQLLAKKEQAASEEK